MKTHFYTVNCLADNHSENIDVSQSKFERLVF